MSDLNIAEVVDRLDSSTQSERKEALRDLKHILIHNRHKSKKHSITDKSFFALYEALFRVNSLERSQYARANSKSTKSASANRLEQCADALRLSIEFGVHRLQRKTVKAILDHVIQTLPMPGGGFCEPLLMPYVKCMRCILEYQPHVEHLSAADWRETVEFCISQIVIVDDHASMDSLRVPQSGSRRRDASADSTSRCGTREPQEITRQGGVSPLIAQELVLCLRQLVAVPNAPVLDKAQDCLDSLTGFLQSAKHVGRAHQDAFAAINSILLRIHLQHCDMSQRTIMQLLPVMRDLWQTRTASSLKDEILTSLVICQEQLAAMLQSKSPHDLEDVRTSVEALLDCFYSEYSKRLPRDQLQIDDLRLQLNEVPCAYSILSTPMFCLSTGFRSENHWMILSLMGTLALMLNRDPSKVHANSDDNSVRPRKRIRYTNRFTSLLDELHRPASDKLPALQLLTFMLFRMPCDGDTLGALLDRLIACASDKAGSVSAWAFLCVASAAHSTVSTTTSLTPAWTNLWEQAARNAVVASSCRPACLAMQVILELGILPYSAIASSNDSMLASIELSGPALIADSSLTFFATVIENASTENPSRSDYITDRVVRWMFSKFSSAFSVERSYAAQGNQHFSAADVLGALYHCLGRMHPSQAASASAYGSIGHACLHISQHHEMAAYLLLLNDGDTLSKPRRSKKQPRSSSDTITKATTSLEARVIDTFLAQAEEAADQLELWWTERPQNISLAMIRVYSTLAVVASAIEQKKHSINSSKANILYKHTNRLVKTLVEVVLSPDSDLARLDTLIDSLRPSLPSLGSSAQTIGDAANHCGITKMAIHLTRGLDTRENTLGVSLPNSHGDELMDLDDEFESQPTPETERTQLTESPRTEATARSDPSAVKASTLLHLRFITAAFESPDAQQKTRNIPSNFVDYLVSLTAVELYCSRSFLDELLEAKLVIQATDLDRWLTYLGETVLGPYTYNHSEVGLCICIDILTAYISLWAKPEAGDLHDSASDLYEWLLTTLVTTNYASPITQIGMSNLLLSAYTENDGFAETADLLSPRTALLTLLQNGSVIVKDHVSTLLPTMFQRYVLALHDGFLTDIAAVLPSDPEWLEGIALRLIVFTRLGSQWPTILRRCVWSIFEVAGNVDPCDKHAAVCTEKLSSALHLASTQELFVLFSRQLFYTWTDIEEPDTARPYQEIPYSIFKYESLAQLLSDTRDEAFAQAVMRSSRVDMDTVIDEVGISEEVLTELAISRVFAYTMSKDTDLYSIKQDVGRGKTFDSSLTSQEKAVSVKVGEKKYQKLLKSQLPQILGLLVLHTDLTHTSRISLPQREIFGSARKNLEKMMAFSHSDQKLPPDQQPSFEALTLFHRIDRLCRRSVYTPETMLVPSILVFVMRTLLSQLRPELGSLHACSIIRKIRVVIALAGDYALKGYPLQMALHALRPYLTDFQCANDALGIAQYLFTSGHRSLQNQLSFISGVGLSVLLSLRKFLGTSQDSTTQESQYTATMSKTAEFHAWLSEYLSDLAKDKSASNGDHKRILVSQKAFGDIMFAAAKVQADGNSRKGSPESTLLLEILRDDMRDDRLLSRASQELVLTILCNQFQYADSPLDDILGADEDAIYYAQAVWRSCQHRRVPQPYLVWASRVLGRAFSAKGEVNFNLRYNTPSDSEDSLDYNESERTSSRSKIIRLMYDFLFSGTRAEAGLVEQTLRSILSQLKGNDQDIEIQAFLSPSTIDSLTFEKSFKLDGFKNIPVLDLAECASPSNEKTYDQWIRDLVVSLAHRGAEDAVLGVLSHIGFSISGIAEKLFPFVLHLVLEQQYEKPKAAKEVLSAAFNAWFDRNDNDCLPQIRSLVTALVYLRSRPVPKETTCAERNHWLDIDFLCASRAAAKCHLYRMSLLFLETHASPPVRVSRRSSVIVPTVPVDLQVDVYKNLDEPDSFYGIEQEPNIPSLLSRLDYESNGMKSLLFRGARLDSQMRRSNQPTLEDSRGVMTSLSALNLNTITQSLLSSSGFQGAGTDSIESVFNTARKLEQWDIRAPETFTNEPVTVYRAFQGISTSGNAIEARKHVDIGLTRTLKGLLSQGDHVVNKESFFRVLAVLCEADDVLGLANEGRIDDGWSVLKRHAAWMEQGRVEDFRPILSSRETLLSILTRNVRLRESIKAPLNQLYELQASNLLTNSRISRKHGAFQDALASATYLSDIAEDAKEFGVHLEGSALFESARILWDQGETTTAIRILQKLNESKKLQQQLPQGSLSQILLELGRYLAGARVESAQEIATSYLRPAIKELKANTRGPQAGEVFHTYASFCDAQLNSDELNDELARVQARKEQKGREIEEFKNVVKSLKLKDQKPERDKLRRDIQRMQKWYDIDDQEYGRLRGSKEIFVSESLKNYLLSLRACDNYDSDVLRVFALWLDFSETPRVIEVMKDYLEKAPPGKFAVLMNQLSSRLQEDKTPFQEKLSDLVFQICLYHPYHGMHQIYAGYVSQGVDAASKSRNASAKQVGHLLGKEPRSTTIWKAIYDSNACYHQFAMISKEEIRKLNKEPTLGDLAMGKRLQTKVPSLKVPPATLAIEVRPDHNYQDLPIVTGWRSKVSIAGGISAPKIATAVASDGQQYKQLFKSGSDDLRQDAIMEQVFEQASKLLKNHTSTRLRNLHIRSYKVLPLSSRSGVIEFVKDTVPLADAVLPAHRRYNPRDWKSDDCRKKVSEVSNQGEEQRVKVYREVCENFHPIMRFFFLERFVNPDDWFEKRLAYTRTTAAISILGHVLGLGDRHCQNILLDQTSGEVVHIDLGVAFEAGRILPVPEVVPFRLTRDLVDAMGFTKTEGVFRRCCEFTLEALREERESIMTLLNVLRYDPLVSWTVSANRARRMQEHQEQQEPTGYDGLKQNSKKHENDSGEAGRALAVVEQKLSGNQSVSTVVSGLIQQATDERNLAVLFCGWSAWC